MNPFPLLLWFSLIHPFLSGTMVRFGVLDALIGTKGAPVGAIYDVLSLTFFVLNAPGTLLTLPWWETPFFHAPAWKIASGFTIIFISWVCLVAIAFGFSRMILSAYLRRFPALERRS